MNFVADTHIRGVPAIRKRVSSRKGAGPTNQREIERCGQTNWGSKRRQFSFKTFWKTKVKFRVQEKWTPMNGAGSGGGRTEKMGCP